NCSTNEIKSLMVNRSRTSRDFPYSYKKLRTNGITTAYENTMPATKSATAGTKMCAMPDFADLLIAGEINADISIAITGIEPMMPTSADTYIWAKNAWPGAVCTSVTPSGRRL